jgi:beta-lactamase superfamily II metal-dependent hydrolase
VIISPHGRKEADKVYEIDFLPVGDGERGGDAIALRFGTQLTPQQQSVVVLDGGTQESGAALVSHIKNFYGTTVVNLVVCTHSDSDHASGLTEVLENLTVKNLAMHPPWNHAANIDELFKDPKINEDKLKSRFKKSLDNAHQLEQLAKKKNIPVIEPFSDATQANSTLSVLGPSKKFYEELLLSYRGAPEAVVKQAFAPKVFAAAVEAVKWVAENWGIETLSEPDVNASSAENNSSVILLFKDSDEMFLFTSDAGVPALAGAVEVAKRIGVDLNTVNRLQVPHHGSKHNVGPAILNVIVGPKKAAEQITKSAIVSAPKKGEPRHPSKKVVMPLSGEGRRSLRPKARRFAAVAPVLLNGRIGLTRFPSHSPIKSKSNKTWSYPSTSIRIERDF